MSQTIGMLVLDFLKVGMSHTSIDFATHNKGRASDARSDNGDVLGMIINNLVSPIFDIISGRRGPDIWHEAKCLKLVP